MSTIHFSIEPISTPEFALNNQSSFSSLIFPFFTAPPDSNIRNITPPAKSRVDPQKRPCQSPIHPSTASHQLFPLLFWGISRVPWLLTHLLRARSSLPLSNKNNTLIMTHTLSFPSLYSPINLSSPSHSICPQDTRFPVSPVSPIIDREV